MSTMFNEGDLTPYSEDDDWAHEALRANPFPGA